MKKQDLASAFDLLEPSQETKYNIKNAINQKTEGRKPFFKRFRRPALAMICFILASLLVISAAAIGGLTYFNALYGDKAETLIPYGIAIRTSAQNNDVVLTLHESVADEYATAYIFSITGLTDAGKSLVVNNTLGSNANETVFKQTNREEIHVYTVVIGTYETTSVERTPPEENADCQLYELHQQKKSDGDYLYFDIGLRRNNVMYNAENNASYVIIPIESLREEDCEYYALYIITPEAQQLTLTFSGLELSLPEAAARIPGVEVQIGGYIQDYFLNEGGMAQFTANFPISAVLTPLGLYIDDESIGGSFGYRHAVLVFNDGSETELCAISNDQAVVSWKAYPRFYQGTVYLFNEIIDVSTVKSLLFYYEIEFPFDGSAPFVRSSGRNLEQNGTRSQLWSIAEQIQTYVADVCPDTWSITSPFTGESLKQSGWHRVNYVNDETLYFNRTNREHERVASFAVSLTEAAGGTLEDEARAMVEKLNVQHHARGFENDLAFNVTGAGVYYGTEVLVVECGESLPDLYRRCIFALYEGKLLTIAYDGYTGHPNDYAFDVLLDLITFE